jgi:hypothetical protein
MKRMAFASGIIAVILIVLLGALISQVKFRKTRQPLDQTIKVPILYEFPGRVVYTNDTTVDQAPFEKDCRARGGVFNLCGRSCPPEAEICAEVCAYTCELSGAKTVSLPDQCDGEPQFEKYAVSEIYQGKVATVDFLAYPEAAQFRTVIRTGASKGANFAGHYAVIEWGCGTSCQDHAIVDVVNGKLVVFGLQSFYGVTYNLNSSLLVANPAANLPEDSEQVITTDFYVLQDNNLNFSCRLPGTSPRIPR